MGRWASQKNAPECPHLLRSRPLATFSRLLPSEFRVIGHDNRQQLGSHLRETKRLRRPAFVVFAIGLHSGEAKTTRRQMPSG
jgi:hypothetical protein